MTDPTVSDYHEPRCELCDKLPPAYVFLYCGSPYKGDAVYAGACAPCAVELHESGDSVHPLRSREIEPGGSLDSMAVVPVVSSREALAAIRADESSRNRA